MSEGIDVHKLAREDLARALKRCDTLRAVVASSRENWIRLGQAGPAARSFDDELERVVEAVLAEMIEPLGSVLSLAFELGECTVLEALAEYAQRGELDQAGELLGKHPPSQVAEDGEAPDQDDGMQWAIGADGP